MDRIIDELTMLQTLYRFTQAQDRLDLTTMAAQMVPDRKVKFDLTKHFPEAGVMEGNAAEICDILYEASAGWTATQHPVYNPVVTFDSKSSSKATVHAMVQAYHCLEVDGQVDALTVRAVWIIEMEKLNEKWLIADMAMVRDIPMGNLALFGKMQERMAAGVKRQPVSK